MATDFYQLRIQGLHQTEYNECVLHCKGVNLTAANYFENAEDLALAFEAACRDAWTAMMPASYQLLRLSAKKASAGGGAAFNFQYQIDSQPGQVAGGAASQQLCPVVRLIPPMGVKTAGKFFLPCIAESQIAANAPSAGWAGNLATLMNVLVGPFQQSSIDWSLCIFSRKNGTFADVLAYDTSPIVGFQRRRQRAAL